MPITTTDMCIVHVGISLSHVMAAIVYLRDHGEQFPIVEGDGWFVWGETAGSLKDDGDIFHIQIPSPNPQRTVVSLLTAGFDLRELGYRGSASRHGTVAVITDPTSDDDRGLEVTWNDLARNLAGYRRPRRRTHPRLVDSPWV